MKKVLVFILCFGVLTMFLAGCAKKEVKEEAKPAKEEVEKKEAVPESVGVAEPETTAAEQE